MKPQPYVLSTVSSKLRIKRDVRPTVVGVWAHRHSNGWLLRGGGAWCFAAGAAASELLEVQLRQVERHTVRWLRVAGHTRERSTIDPFAV